MQHIQVKQALKHIFILIWQTKICGMKFT